MMVKLNWQVFALPVIRKRRGLVIRSIWKRVTGLKKVILSMESVFCSVLARLNFWGQIPAVGAEIGTKSLSLFVFFVVLSLFCFFRCVIFVCLFFVVLSLFLFFSLCYLCFVFRCVIFFSLCYLYFVFSLSYFCFFLWFRYLFNF